MKRNNNKGFTLAELLIVVAIIAVLVAVAIPTFADQLEKSRQSVDTSNLRGAYAAARLAEIDQAVGDQTFKEVCGYSNTNANSEDVSKLIYWYYPDEGKLSLASASQTADQAVAAKMAEYGKASKGKAVADMSQFSMQKIKSDYSGSLNKEGTNTGTRDKAILVQFGKKIGESGTYGIYSISFVHTAVGNSSAVAASDAARTATTVVMTVAGNDSAALTAAGATVAAINTTTVTNDVLKTVALEQLFAFEIAGIPATDAKIVAGSLSVSKNNATATDGMFTISDDNLGIKINVKASEGSGTYKAEFDVTAKNGSNTDYVVKVELDVTATLDTARIPTNAVRLRATCAGTPTATVGEAVTGVTVQYSTASTGDNWVTATSMFSYGYSKTAGATELTEDVTEAVKDTGGKILKFSGNVPNVTGAKIYVICEAATTPTINPVQVEYGEDTALTITAG